MRRSYLGTKEKVMRYTIDQFMPNDNEIETINPLSHRILYYFTDYMSQPVQLEGNSSDFVVFYKCHQWVQGIQ